MPKHKSEDYKLSAVNYYLTENNNQLQTCKIFKCSRRNLMRWVNKYKQNNQILRQNRKPVAYKLQNDETSIKSLQKRKFCYSEKGKRCVLKTDNNEVFKKYTGIFSISTKGVLGWELYEKGGINTERLYDFFRETYCK